MSRVVFGKKPHGPTRAPARALVAAALVGAIAAVTVAGCGKLDDTFCSGGNCGWSRDEIDRVSALADLPSTPPADVTNELAGNPDAIALGHKFFFDARFSGNSNATDALGRPVPYTRAPKGQPSNLACVSCHDLGGGGADPSTLPGNVSVGASWSDVNALSIWNLAFQKLYSWNGRADSLWAQAAGLIEGTTFGSNRLRVAWAIANNYREEYNAVVTAVDPTHPLPIPAGATPDARFPADGKKGNTAGCQAGDASEPFGDAYDCMAAADQTEITRVLVNFGKIIGAYEAQLISRDSPFDQFVADLRAGKADESTAIAARAKLGARLFVGKAGCSDCHNTPLLSDGQFYNVGIQQVGAGVPTMADCPAGNPTCDCGSSPPSKCLPFGAFDGFSKLSKSAFRRDSMWAAKPDTSLARFYDPPADGMKGAFRVPGLRNVALTAPYMHDGALATLEEVVQLYNRGGDPDAVGHRYARIKPLMLTDDEQAALVAFLRTLNGKPVDPTLIAAPVLP